MAQPMHNTKLLHIPLPNVSLQNTLSNQLGISKVLSQILINRQIHSGEEARQFLEAKLDSLNDPYSFSDMQKAVWLIRQAAQNRERVMLFGDYDVDGVTSLTLLKTVLSGMGIDALHYIPHRVKEGYGMTKDISRMSKAKGVKLLITADCGTNSHNQIRELRENNIEVIITDHHEAQDDSLSSASAVINPKVKGSTYKYRELAGVGVAYKLCQALTKQNLFEHLDLVSLGTIGDVVPLTGENRIICREGLTRLSKTQRPGLKALMETSGIKNRAINSTFVSYILGPRINASGRMDTADTSLRLLLSSKEDEAMDLAKIIESHNRQRQRIESKIIDEAEEIIDREINFKEQRVIVLAKENWHMGVLGIVASKLADRFYRPVIIISLTEDLCKGSGRSIRNFHLFHALKECKEFLEAFGGHSHAVGLAISRDSIEDFRNTINRLAQDKLRLEDLLPRIDIDAQIALSDINYSLIEEIERMEPFGCGNPEPLFHTPDLKLKSVPQVLSRNTLKLWVTDGEATYPAIGFGMSGLNSSFTSADSFDLVYNLKRDDWQGMDTVILEIQDVFFK